MYYRSQLLLFRILYKCWKQLLCENSDTSGFFDKCNIINAFIVNFDQFNVSLVDKMYYFYQQQKKLQIAKIVIYTLGHVVCLTN